MGTLQVWKINTHGFEAGLKISDILIRSHLADAEDIGIYILQDGDHAFLFVLGLGGRCDGCPIIKAIHFEPIFEVVATEDEFFSLGWLGIGLGYEHKKGEPDGSPK
jgi:hypothetical protein